MAEESTYTDPGVYQRERIVPSNTSIASLPIAECIVGIAPRVRRITDEAVVRGSVAEESLTVSAVAGAHSATLVNHGDRKKQNTVIRRDSITLRDVDYSYPAAELAGTVAEPYVLNGFVSNAHITLSVDGLAPLRIDLGNAAAETAANVVLAINAALLAAAAYGAAYSTVASVAVGNTVTLTSPTTGFPTDIRLYATFDVLSDAGAPAGSASNDASAIIFGAAFAPPYQAPVTVLVTDAAYVAGSTWEMDYVCGDLEVDGLENTNIQSLVRVGAYPGVGSYEATTDYQLTTNTVDWSPDEMAALTGTGTAFQPFAIVAATNDALSLAMNGLAAVDITLSAGAAQTAQQICDDINDAMNADAAYGARYQHVATPATIGANVFVRITAPSPFQDDPSARGVNSIVELQDVGDNASATVFGVATTAMPHTVMGTGVRPAFATTYFVTYEFTRATTDYDAPVRCWSEDQLYEFTNPITLTNIGFQTAAIAGELAFENGALSVFVQLVNDASGAGSPTVNQFKTAIDNCEDSTSITDMVVLSTNLAVQAYLVQHVASMCTQTEKRYRRGWFGAARDTTVGDKDTAGTLVHLAQVTLQVPGDSPGRGRYIVSAPPNVSRDQTLEDGTEVTAYSLDSTYLSVAVAGRMASFTNPATSLLKKQITGFNVDNSTATNFQTYKKGPRQWLAQNGVNVVTLTGGQLVLTDPVTTEQGAGGLSQFVEISASAQKDNIVRNVDTALDSNLVGIVPTDLADFLYDIKVVIATTIAAAIATTAIGPYVDENGNRREINMAADIQVFRSPTNPVNFLFRYFFMLRYPAKRMFGDYSVDNPFWTQGSQTPTS